MEIRPISKSLFTSEEVSILAGLVLDELQDEETYDKFVIVLIKKLKQAHIALDDSLGSTKRNTLTKELAEADYNRDLAFRAFYNYIKAGTIRLNEPFSLAANKVMEHLKKVDRSLPNMGYTHESAELKIFFKEMKKVDSELKVLIAKDWLAEVKQAEMQFLDKFDEKLKEEKIKMTSMPIAEARKQTIYQLGYLVNAFNTLAEAGEYDIIKQNVKIDRIIQQFEVPARARLTRRSNGTEEVTDIVISPEVIRDN